MAANDKSSKLIFCSRSHDGGANGIPVDKYGEVIGYNNNSDNIGGAQNAAAQFSGNISWQMYNMYNVNFTGISGTTSLVGFSYVYDNANRLKASDFGYFTGSTWKNSYYAYYGSFSYDSSGNIKILNRNDSSGYYYNNMIYHYKANINKLESVTGLSNASYTYDSNGNVVSDSHRDIAFIIYDSDNLPVRIYKTNGKSQFYTEVYPAYSGNMNGNRTRKTVNGSTDRFYFNSIDGKTEAVCLLPYSSDLTYNIWGLDNIGQVRVNYNYVTGRYYYLKDHLGTIKMVVKSDGSVDSYDDYYPYGTVMPGRSSVHSADTRYKFTSKFAFNDQSDAKSIESSTTDNWTENVDGFNFQASTLVITKLDSFS